MAYTRRAVGGGLPPSREPWAALHIAIAQFYYNYSIEAKARSIRSIVGKWNIWVMRCGSFTSGNTQTPNCWLQGLHTLTILYKSNILLQQAGYGHNSLLIVTVHWSLHEKRKSLSSSTFRQKYTKIRIAGRKGTRQELSYRKQIARQLCTQYVEGIHRPWPWNLVWMCAVWTMTGRPGIHRILSSSQWR